MARRFQNLLLSLLLWLLCGAFSTMPDQGMEMLYDRGTRYRTEGKVDSCLMCFQQALALWDGTEKGDMPGVLASLYCDMGGMLAAQRENYVEAFRYFTLAQDIARRHGLDFQMSVTSLNMANLYSYYGDYANTLSNLLESMRSGLRTDKQESAIIAFQSILTETVDADSARRHLTEALALADSIDPETPNYPAVEHCRAVARCWLGGDLPGAILATRKWIRDDKMSYVDLTTMLGNLLTQAGQSREAVQLLRKVWQMRGASLDPVRLMAAQKLVSLYKRLGQRDSTLLWYENYHALNDSLFKGQHYGVLRDLASDIANTRAQQQLASERQRRQRATVWLLVAVAFLVIVSAGAVVILRQNRELRRRSQALFKNDTERLKLAKATDAGTDTGDAKEQQEAQADTALMKRIREIMATTDIITSPEFTLTTLAHHCGVSVRTASAAINHATGDNFNVMLATARVRIASLRLRDPASANLTIEAVARDLGFQSRSNFASQFRRVTGLNPSEYRRLARESATDGLKSAK